jgi:GT2 family glycosyltransferase
MTSIATTHAPPIPPPRVLVVIVNFRLAGMVIDCLNALAVQRQVGTSLRVQVVDNRSEDGSLELISAAIAQHGWADWVFLTPSERNGGFAYGNNVGITAGLTPEVGYVLLLNPDTVPRDGAVKKLVAFLEANPRAGIAGSALEDAAGQLDRSAHTRPSPLGELEGSARLGLLTRMLKRHVVSPPVSHAAHQCDWVSGASMMIRRGVLDEVGLMDEGFFLYFEEVDYCLRALNAGWQVWFVPESRVVHLEGSATGIRQRHRRRPAYWYASRRRFFLKHYGVAGTLAADVLWAVGHASLRFRRALGVGKGGDLEDPLGMAKDLLLGDLWALLSSAWTTLRH